MFQRRQLHCLDSGRGKVATNKTQIKSLPLPIKSLKVPHVEFQDKIEDHYEFGIKLGVGTYGEVRQATCKATSKPVAIKICRGKTAIEVLRKEADVLRQLSDNCFPNFIDFRINAVLNRAYLVMELIEGETLDKLVENSDALDEGLVLE